MLDQNKNLLECVEIEPEGQAERSIIWLHGLGADGHDFVPMVPEIDLPKTFKIRFIFPHAPIMPVTLNNGYKMRAWFDIVSITDSQTLDVKGITQSVNQVKQLIARENERGIATNKIILAGFSQGGVIALTTSLMHPERLNGVIGLSTFLPGAPMVLANASNANKDLPILLAHGTEDTVLPYVLGEMTKRTLKQANYPVTWHSYPIPHSVCPQEILDIKSWLTHTIMKT